MTLHKIAQKINGLFTFLRDILIWLFSFYQYKIMQCVLFVCGVHAGVCVAYIQWRNQYVNMNSHDHCTTHMPAYAAHAKSSNIGRTYQWFQLCSLIHLLKIIYPQVKEGIRATTMGRNGNFHTSCLPPLVALTIRVETLCTHGPVLFSWYLQ